MPVYQLKSTTFRYTLPLIDNLGNSYTARDGSVVVTNDSPALTTITPDANPITGSITTLAANGTASWHFTAVSLKGTAVSGSDSVIIVDVLPPEDANQVVAKYAPALS